MPRRGASLFTKALVAIGVVAVLGYAVVRFLAVPNERPEVASAVVSAVDQARNAGTVDFRTLTTFDWDRMYAFGAYTSDADVSRVLGFPWGTDENLRLPSDGFVLLIFAKDRGVSGWVVVNDHQSSGPLVQFDDSLLAAPIPRDHAIFRANLRADRTVGGWQIYDLSLSQ